jgi:transporter family-2 protein
MGKLGAAAATAAIILCQTGTALVIDCLGCFGMEKLPFSWLRLLGVFFLVTGAWLMLRVKA